MTALEEIAAEFITRCVDRVTPIAKDGEAFAMIQEAVGGFLRFVAGKVDDATQKASGSRRDEIEPNQFTKAARDLYERTKEDLRRQLEIHRFTFTVPQTTALTPELRRAAPSLVPELRRAAPEKNRGGKPLAAHWDEMWAAVAVMLYEGDLQPQTQADVERAMKDWFAANDIDVGDTAVRDRARKLWQRLKDTS